MDLAELLEVGRADRATVKSLGTMVRPLTSTERWSSISRTSAAPELDRTQRRSEGPGEHALDHTLQAVARTLDAHPGEATEAESARGRHSTTARARPIAADDASSRAESGAPSAPMGPEVQSLAFHRSLGRVAEWQTRWLQVPVSERTWGFKSPLAHSEGTTQPRSLEPTPAADVGTRHDLDECRTG